MTTEPIYVTVTRRDTQAERAREERQYKFSEARHLLAQGVAPERIAEQLGTTCSALERLGRNWDAPDIVDAFRVPKSRTRPDRRCIECGARRGGKNHGQRCWDCYVAGVRA